MTIKIIKVFILFFFVGSYTYGKTNYPADSLLLSKNIGLIKKLSIVPIAGWQRISYNSKFFNCQFYPSCSNYGAQAIKTKGPIIGLFYISDRIVRCNHEALYYHKRFEKKFKLNDNRLIDYINIDKKTAHSLRPIKGVFLSSVVPGLGRAYGGRTVDGIFGFILFNITASAAYKAHKNNDNIKKSIFFCLTGIIYGGEILGAYRANKHKLY